MRYATRVAPIPLFVGAIFWAGATALFLEDAFNHNTFTITHALQPLLTLGTVASAVWVHKARWHLKPAFLALALLGSLLTCYGTMGRQADTRDAKEQEARRQNRSLEAKQEELRDAKGGAKAECIKLGPRCQAWQARVDALTREASGLRAVSVDARADAIAKLATFAGVSGGQTKAFVSALDPVALPLFLELGSVLFFAAAFPKVKRRKYEEIETLATESEETVSVSIGKDAALRDFRSMRQAGAQKLLAQRWGVSEGTVSKWLSSWERDNLVNRTRQGKAKPVLALPSPQSSNA
jgi:transposase-like protein